jgi:hypothetical protein
MFKDAHQPVDRANHLISVWDRQSTTRTEVALSINNDHNVFFTNRITLSHNDLPPIVYDLPQA